MYPGLKLQLVLGYQKKAHAIWRYRNTSTKTMKALKRSVTNCTGKKQYSKNGLMMSNQAKLGNINNNRTYHHPHIYTGGT